jgi:hypothetical protein
MPATGAGSQRDPGEPWSAALETKLARAARARRQAHSAFALLLGLAASVWSAAALLASGLSLWPAPSDAFQFAGGHGLWPLGLCLACGAIGAAAFWAETRLDAFGLADALDRAEGHGGELRTAFELCRARPEHPLLPALCRRLFARTPGAERWRALSPPAWLGLLPLLLSSALLLEALGPRDRTPAGLPELLAGGAAQLEQASSLAAAEALRRAEQNSPSARRAQADLARAAIARVQGAFEGAALRAKDPRANGAMGELATRLEEAEAKLAELEASRFAGGQAAPAIAEARARLDAARLLAGGGRRPPGPSGAESEAFPGSSAPQAGEPRSSRAQGSAAGEASTNGGEVAAVDPAGDPLAGPAPGASGAGPAPGGSGPERPREPSGEGGPGRAPAVSNPVAPATWAAGATSEPAAAAPGPVIGASEAPVVAAWVALRARQPPF